MKARMRWFSLATILVATGVASHSVSAQQYQYPPGGDDEGGYSIPGSATPAQPPSRSIPGTATQAQPPGHSVPGSALPAQPPAYSIPNSAQPADISTYPGQSSPPYYSIPDSAVPAESFYPPYPPTQSSQWQLGVQGHGGTPGVEPGFYVRYVVPNSAAERLGIEARDYIVQINGQSIQSVHDLRQALAWSQGYARILVLDHRTNRYMWHTGSLR